MFSKLTSLRRAAAILMLATALAPTALARDDVHSFAPQSAWTTFDMTPGRFRVAMPGQPAYAHQTLSSEAGPVDYHSFILDTGDTAYGASYATYTTTNLSLDRCVDGMAEGLGGHVVSSYSISYGRYPGREATIACDNGAFAKARAFAVGAHIYQIMVVTRNPRAAAASTARFLDSFELV